MSHRSIVGASIARELLSQLEANTDAQFPFTVSHEDGEDTYTARRCSVGALHRPTGGLNLCAETWIPDSLCGKKNPRYTRHLVPGWTRRQMEFAVSGLNRKVIDEKLRQAPLNKALADLEALAVPLRDNATFIAAISERELTEGVSNYSEMTLEQINGWIAWVKDWLRAAN